MKPFNLFVAFAGLVAMASNAAAQGKFYVVKGNEVIFSYDGVPDYVTFSQDDLPDTLYSVDESVGGTVGHGVQLYAAADNEDVILWADHNLGASRPEESGAFFAWGETADKSLSPDGYSWASYSFMSDGNADWNMITKYTFADDKTDAIWYDANGEFIGDGLTTLASSDDAAAVNWGDDWRMPTHTEFKHLKSRCKWTWTDSYEGSGVAGYVVRGKGVYACNSIFLPAAGYRSGDSLFGVGVNGRYWSSELNDENSDLAWDLYFYNGGISAGFYDRFYGRTIRAVHSLAQ